MPTRSPTHGARFVRNGPTREVLGHARSGARLFIALLVVTLLGSTLVHAQSWSPPNPGRLDEIASRLEVARAERDDTRLELGIAAYAVELAAGVPDGAFALSRDRWIGPSRYLETFLDALSIPARERAIATIASRIRGALQQNPTSELSRRWYRDFPFLPEAETARRRVALRAIEQGRIRTGLSLASDALPAEQVRELEKLLVSPSERVSDAPELPVFVARSSIELEPLPSSPESPWRQRDLERLIAFDEASIFIPGLEGLTAINRTSGTTTYRATSFERDPAPLVGSAIGCVLRGETAVISDGRRLRAYGRRSGSRLWNLPFRRLLTRVDADEPSNPNLLSTSTPIATDRGFVVALVALEQGFVTGELALIDADARVVWQRPIGGVASATYLALGSARPLVAIQDDRIIVATQRGVVSCHHLADGSFEWAIRYPSFDPRSLSDALQNDDGWRVPVLHATDDRIVVAPMDASAAFVISRSGRIVASIPRGLAEYIGVSEDGTRIGLVEPERFTEWRLPARISGTGPVIRGPLLRDDWEFGRFGSETLASSRPRLVGPPIAVNDAWWIPRAGGVAIAKSDRSILGLSPVRTIEPIDRIDRAGRTLVCHHRSGVSVHLIGDAKAPESRDAMRARALAAIEKKDPSGLESAIADLAATPDADVATIVIELLLDGGADRFGLTTDAFERTIDQGLEVLRKAEAAGLANSLGVRAGLVAIERGRREIGLRRLERVLAENPRARWSLGGDRTGIAEFVVRRVLRRLEAENLEFDAQRREDAARAALDEVRARRRSSRTVPAVAAQELDAVQRSYPRTRAGRQAALDLADLFYRSGSRALAIRSLERLRTLETSTAEGLEAALEEASLEAELGRFDVARQRLERLRQNFGRVPMKSGDRTLTIADRVDEVLADLPRGSSALAVESVQERDLLEVWASRSELEQRRVVDAIGIGDDRLLSVGNRDVILRSARTGLPVWRRHIPDRLRDENERWLERGVFRDPVVESGRIFVCDEEEVVCLDLETGETRWRRRLVAPLQPQRIRKLRVNGNRVVTLDSDSTLQGLDLETGETMWTVSDRGPFVAEPELAEGRIALASALRATVEVIDVSDGRTITTLTQPPRSGEAFDVVSAPRIIDGHVIVPTARSVEAYDLERSVWAWSYPTSTPVEKLHEVDAPFVIIEVEGRAPKATLLGVHVRAGQLVWKKVLAGSNIRSIDRFGHHLYVMESRTFRENLLSRLDIPASFLEETPLELLPPAELETIWTRSLGGQFDLRTISEHREWLLVRQERGGLVVLQQIDGSRVDERPLRRVLDHLQGRQRLWFAEFVGDTLVALTARGDVGFRRLSSLEIELFEREMLESWNPLDPSAERVGTDVLAESRAAFLRGDLELACQIVEVALLDPGRSRTETRELEYYLEGVAQLKGERSPPRWECGRLDRAPIIDGALDEPWNAARAFPLDVGRYFQAIQGGDAERRVWAGWRDLSAILLLGWSEEGFHVGIDVTDDSVHPHDRESDRWIGDLLLIALDLRGDGGTRPDRDDVLLSLALTVPKPKNPPPAPGEPGEGGGDAPPDEEEKDETSGEYQVQRKTDGSGVIYEMTIPWETFREQRNAASIPALGMQFGLNLILTDDDSGRGARTYLSITPGQKLRERARGAAWEYFIPEHFARIELVPR